MVGIYKFISFVCIYYLVLSFIDLYGSVVSYRSRLKSSDGVGDLKLKFDFNTDLAAVCAIYLLSYYLGVFE